MARKLLNGNHTFSVSTDFSEYSYKMARVSRFLLWVKGFLQKNSKEMPAVDIGFFKINVKCFYRSAVANSDEQCMLRLPLWVDNKASVVSQLEIASLDVSGMYETVVQPVTENDLSIIGYHVGSCPNAELATENVVSVKFRYGDDIAPILLVEEAWGGQ